MHNKSVLRFFTLAIVAALFAATGLQIFVSQVLASAPPVVHIIPSSIENTGNVPVTAVLGTPDASLNQVKARTFEATSPVGHASVPLPGGTHAAGELLLVNTTAKSLIIPSVVIIGNSGVKVGFHGPITLPVGLPGYVRVPAFALDPGQRGNIPSDDIRGYCCAPGAVSIPDVDPLSGVFITNAEAFTGGQDSQPDNKMGWAEFGYATNDFITELAQSARTKLAATIKQNIKANERVFTGSFQCQQSIQTDHLIGDSAVNATITMSGTVTCAEETYDYQAVVATAVQSAQHNTLGIYTLVNRFYLQVTPLDANGTMLSFNVQVRSMQIYHLGAGDLQYLAAQLAGKSQAEARALLLQNELIYDVQFSTGSGRYLPEDTQKFQVVADAVTADLPPIGPKDIEDTVNCTVADPTPFLLACSDPTPPPSN